MNLYPRFKFYSFKLCLLLQVFLYGITLYFCSYLGFTTFPDKLDTLINTFVSMMLLFSSIITTVRNKVIFVISGVLSILSWLSTLALSIWKIFGPNGLDPFKIYMLIPVLTFSLIEIVLSFVARFTKNHEAQVKLTKGEQRLIISHTITLGVIFILCCAIAATTWQNGVDLGPTALFFTTTAFNIKLLIYFLLPKKYSLLRRITSCCYAEMREEKETRDDKIDDAKYGEIKYMHRKNASRREKEKAAEAARQGKVVRAHCDYCCGMAIHWTFFFIVAFPSCFVIFLASGYSSRLGARMAELIYVVPIFLYIIITTIVSHKVKKRRGDDEILRPAAQADAQPDAAGVPDVAAGTIEVDEEPLPYPTHQEMSGDVQVEMQDYSPAAQESPQPMPTD